MTDRGDDRPAAVLAVHAAVAFLLLSMLPSLLWVIGQDHGWFDLGSPQLRREAGAMVFTITCALVLAFARLVPPPLPWRPAAVGRVLAVYLPFVAAWGVGIVGYLRAMHGLGHPVAPQDLLAYFHDGDPARPWFWLVTAMMVLLAPLAEEVVFRGYIQGAFTAMFGLRAGWIVTAAAFGLVHGLVYALPIGVLGLLLGWLRLRHRSLLAPFTAHAVHNGLMALLVFTWPGSLTFLYPP